MGDKIIVQLTISGIITLDGKEISRKGGVAPATEEYGQSVKERRLKKKLKIAQLSRLSGVSGSHIYRIERGERAPGGRIVAKLEKVLEDKS